METNNQKLVEEMGRIAAGISRRAYESFLQYDQQKVAEVEKEEFPLVWQPEGVISLASLPEMRAEFMSDEGRRYGMLSGVDNLHYIAGCCYECGYKTFVISPWGLEEMHPKRIKSLYKSFLNDLIGEWEGKRGPLPKRFRPRVKFRGISLGRLLELARESERLGDRSLLRQLDRFHGWWQKGSDHQVTFFWSEEFKEFSWTEKYDGRVGICGALVWHGSPEEGYSSNFSVELEPRYGWGCHS